MGGSKHPGRGGASGTRAAPEGGGGNLQSKKGKRLFRIQKHLALRGSITFVVLGGDCIGGEDSRGQTMDIV